MSIDAESDLHKLRQRRLEEFLEMMERRGVNQREIAARAKVPSQYLSDVKKGRRSMTELFARRLHEEFEIDFVWLLGGSGSLTPPKVGAAAPAGETIWLPILPHPIEGEPRSNRDWDGSSIQLAGAAAAKSLAARHPYVLRFSGTDQLGHLLVGDLVLLSQEISTSEDGGIYVVKIRGRLLLAHRNSAAHWTPLLKQSSLSHEPNNVGRCLGILWRAL